MVNDPMFRVALCECVGDSVGAHVVSDRPAETGARMGVDDGGQVDPADPSLDVADVAAPVWVRLAGGRVSADQIRCAHWLVAGDRGLLPRPGIAAPLQTGGLHQPPDPLAGPPDGPIAANSA